MKPKLKLYVGYATHFLKWELPYFQKYYDLVNTPSKDVILFVFGPDVFLEAAHLPALIRVALLFPGFGWNPYFDLNHRQQMLTCLDEYYDLVFVNPGPIHEAFKTSNKVSVCPFSIDTKNIPFKVRTKLNSLLHASADYPQKDWRRSEETMMLTGLKYEVFPSRDKVDILDRITRRLYQKKAHLKRQIEKVTSKIHQQSVISRPFVVPKEKYALHSTVIQRYQKYDGFVHIAGKTPPYVDGKYTATLLEAGLTGSILFWHDTLGLGNDFETIFNLPLQPEEAAHAILAIRESVDIKKHSQRTHEEILERCNPESVLQLRHKSIKALL